MKQKSGPGKAPAEQVLKDIRRQTRRKMISQRTREALKAARDRGVVLGNPGLADVRKRATASVKANADRFAKNVLPLIRDIQSSGVTSLRAIGTDPERSRRGHGSRRSVDGGAGWGDLAPGLNEYQR